MKKSVKIFTTLFAMNLLGAIGCSAGNNAFLNPDFQVGRVEIRNCPSSMKIGEKVTLEAAAFDTEGNPLPDASIAFKQPEVDGGLFLTNADLQATYPGDGKVVASSAGVESPACVIPVAPPPNSGQVQQLTDNDVDDHWGMNNNWPTLAAGRVLWQSTDGVNTTVMLHRLQDPVGQDQPLMSTGEDVDFMALGTGASDSDFLASWRTGLSETWVDRAGTNPQSLGRQLQEENSIADGTLLFRQGQPNNDIFSFSAGGGLMPLAQTGDLSDPIASQGQAVWLENLGNGNANLIYFDGAQTKTLATGPFSPGRYDFREGRAVYTLNNAIYLFDAITGQTTNLTLQSPDEHRFVKTDGRSVLYIRTLSGTANQEVVLVDIASGTEAVISNDLAPKDGDTLRLDLRQAIWVEGNQLFFHDGSGDSQGTSSIPLGNAVLATNYRPALSSGMVAWIGNDGNDTEVFVMK